MRDGVRHGQGFRRLASCAALAALLIAAWLAYRPGLSGGFLFDDFGNLPAIGATGPVDNAATLARYLTSGTADPTGRPLTLASFLLDARDWPASPRPFKLTNLLLHLLNSVLLWAVLLRMGKALTSDGMAGAAARKRWNTLSSSFLSSFRGGPRRSRAEPGIQLSSPAPEKPDSGSPLRGVRNDEIGNQRRSWGDASIRAAALFGAGAWLLHPLFVSTTLYIVQREAMLPATFVLLGMLGWIAARAALAEGRIVRGLLGMALAAGGCTLLAVLSKGNGALLPLLLLLMEWIVLAPALPMPSAQLERMRRIAVGVLLALPSLVLFGWLLAQFPGSMRFAESLRDWSVPQRLLSEARALIEYLGLLWLPRAYSRGLFTDGFTASTSLLHPWTTLPCVLIVLALIVGALALRKRHPALALAILFYFAGQLIESGWLSLELYYEHRNYLPALLMFWPLGIALFAPGRRGILRAVAAVAILAVLGVLTFTRASLWGNDYTQARVWAIHNPGSARAQANAAQFDLAHGRPELAARRLQAAMAQHPDDIQLPVNLIGAECALGGARASTLATLDNALEHSKAGAQLTFHWFDRALALATQRSCPGVDFAALQSMLDAARRNPHWQRIAGRRQDLAHMQGQLDLARGDPQAALRAFDLALAQEPGPATALEQAAMFGAQGYPRFGLAHLDYFKILPPAPKPRLGMPRIHAWVLARQDYWQHETARLRATLAADAAAKQAGSAKPAANG